MNSGSASLESASIRSQLRLVGERTRVLIVHPAMAPYRVDLFRSLADRTDLELLFQRRQISYHRELQQRELRAALTCPHGVLRGNRVLFNRDLPIGLFGAIRRRQPQVLVTSEFSLVTLFAIGARRSSGTRFGHVIWSDENVTTLKKHGRLRHWLRGYCGRRADALVVCSDQVAQAFASRYGVDRARFFRCGVHQAPASVRARCERARPRSLSIMAERALARQKVILYVGRLAPEKNLEVALRALAQAFRQEESLVFVLVGSGSERARLERLSVSLGITERVIFAGHAEGDSLFGWYRLASVLLLASSYEPYGAVVNEALLCGLPVLCSGRAGAAVLIKEGVNGYTFSPHDMSELVDRIRELAPGWEVAGVLAARCRPDLMPVDFESDVNGFLGAIGRAGSAAGEREK